MQVHRLPAGRGLAWIQEGFRLWKRNPALLTFLAFGYVLILLLVSVLPLVGQLAAYLLMPALSLGVLNGARAVALGEKAGPELIFSGFRRNLPGLAAIGGLYLVGSLLAILATALGDGGVLLEAMTGRRKLDEAIGGESDLLLPVLIGTAVSTPVMMAYWFAPMLAGWHGLPAPKALFFSLVACARNWRAFLVYSIGLLVLGGVLPGVVIGLAGLISPMLATLLSVPLPLIMVPVVFASFYPNVRDVFGEPGDARDAS